METSLGSYDPPFSSYPQISGKNGAQFNEKWSYLNFTDGFEFGDLKNPHNRCLIKIQRIHKLMQKNGFK